MQASKPENTGNLKAQQWHFPESFEADLTLMMNHSLQNVAFFFWAQSDNVDQCRYFWMLIFILDFIPSFQLLEHRHMVESGW